MPLFRIQLCGFMQEDVDLCIAYPVFTGTKIVTVTMNTSSST